MYKYELAEAAGVNEKGISLMAEVTWGGIEEDGNRKEGQAASSCSGAICVWDIWHRGVEGRVERIDAGICLHLLFLVSTCVQLLEAVWEECSNFAAHLRMRNWKILKNPDRYAYPDSDIQCRANNEEKDQSSKIGRYELFSALQFH